MKKHLLALILSASTLYVSQTVHAEQQRPNIIDLTADEDDVVEQRTEILPMLVTCTFDEQGNIEVKGVQHLGTKDIDFLYTEMHKKIKKNRTLTPYTALQQMLNGSVHLVTGTVKLLYVGGTWIVPQALSLTGNAFGYLKAKYDDAVEYMHEN